jgi:lipopolysaccharide transport system ATP-binding protein
LVKVENVSKIFCRDLKKSLLYGLQDSARDLLSWGKKSEIRDQRSASPDDPSSCPTSSSRNLRHAEFLAVENVSFELRRGECLGLIGRNGAGKTTLLKMLNGLIKPDAGRIEMRGRIGALIALGAGFNPILSGRENIYVNGSILGLSKVEIDSKIDEIIDFAEIEEFIDAPVQTYSSGMQVRLGFAVATALEPDVLILDEVLAVGDAAFRNKCYNRIGKLQHGAAVIFVSHSMEQVARICNSGLLLRNGGTVGMQSTDAAINSYEKENNEGDSSEDSFAKFTDAVKSARIWTSSEEVKWNGKCQFGIEIELTHVMKAPFMRIFFFSPDGTVAAEWNSLSAGIVHTFPAGTSKWTWEVGPILLRPGRYRASFIIHEQGTVSQPVWFHKWLPINVGGVFSSATPVQIPSSIFIAV